MAPPSSRRRNDHLGIWLPIAATAAIATAGLVAWLWNESDKEDDELDIDSDEYQHTPSSHRRQSSQQHQRRLGYDPSDEPRARGVGLVDDSGSEAAGAGGAGGSGNALRKRAGKGIKLEDRDVSEDGGQSEDSYETRSSYLPSPLSRRRTVDSTFLESPTPVIGGGSGSGARGKLAALGSAIGLFNEPTVAPGINVGDDEAWGKRGDRRRDTMRAVEEPAGRQRPPVIIRRMKKVAIVVSSDDVARSIDGHYSSLLSTLSRDIDASQANIYVLIYTPDLKLAKKDDGSVSQEKKDIDSSDKEEKSHSRSSSFSHVDAPDATEGGSKQQQQEEEMRRMQEKGKQPQRHTSPLSPHEQPWEAPPIDITPLTNRYTNLTDSVINLFTEASRLTVPSQIFPFTTEKGHVHLLCDLRPEVVYIQECLTGAGGDALKAFSGWVGSCVVIPDGSAEEDWEFGRVGLGSGDEDGYGRRGKGREKFYRGEGGAGGGRRIDIVESAFMGEDWRERVVLPMM